MLRCFKHHGFIVVLLGTVRINMITDLEFGTKLGTFVSLVHLLDLSHLQHQINLLHPTNKNITWLQL